MQARSARLLHDLSEDPSREPSPGRRRAARWAGMAIVATSMSTLHGAAWQGGTSAYYDLTMARPCRDRVLPALLARPLVDGLGLALEDAWWLLDVAAMLALLLGVRRLLAALVPERWAELGTWAAPLVLAMTYLPRYTYGVHMPYDFPALAFLAWGLALGLEERWRALYALVLVAAVNRETAIAIPLCLALVRPQAWRPLLGVAAVVVAVRVAVPLSLPAVDGGALSFAWRPENGGAIRWRVNLDEIQRSPCLVLAAHGWLPLAWAALWRDIPADLRRWGAVVAAMSAGMMLVGNVGEARVFGESALLLLPPVVVGVARWVGGHSATTMTLEKPIPLVPDKGLQAAAV